MMKLRFGGTLAVLAVVLVCTSPTPAMAYVGPGPGLSAIGVFLALFMGLILAVFGFVWYPIKRLLRRLRRKEGVQAGAEE
jgi:hypothetical protein